MQSIGFSKRSATAEAAGTGRSREPAAADQHRADARAWSIGVWTVAPGSPSGAQGRERWRPVDTTTTRSIAAHSGANRYRRFRGGSDNLSEMRWIPSALIGMHGLIHLMGFAKGFGYVDLPQLTQPISRPWGLAWLAAAVLVTTSAAMLAQEVGAIGSPERLASRVPGGDPFGLGRRLGGDRRQPPPASDGGVRLADGRPAKLPRAVSPRRTCRSRTIGADADRH